MKKALSLICTLAIVLGMIIPSAHAVTDTTCDCGATNVEWETLTNSTIPEPGKHYRLAGDVTWGSQRSLKTAGKYCIDLAGYTLQHQSNRAFLLGVSGEVTNIEMNIMDSSAGKTGKVLGGTNSTAASGGTIYLYNGVVFNLYGGTVGTYDPDTDQSKIGAIFQLLGGSTLNVYGGSIVGGTALQQAGTINVSAQAKLNVYGGSIVSGTAPVGSCVYVDSVSSKVKLSGDAQVDEIYFNSTPSSSLTISGTYTGSVVLNPKTALSEGAAVAVSDNANIGGATIAVKGTDFAATVSGSNVIVSKGSWCEACKKTVVWQTLTGSLPNAAGHYKLNKNVSASQVSFNAIGGAICFDLAGYTYTSSGRAGLLYDVSGDSIKDTLNIMDSSAAKTGVLYGHGGGTSHASGIFRTYGNTVLNLYDVTVQLIDNGNVVANDGGAIYAGAEVNMYGGKIVGGNIHDLGGAVYVSGTFNMTDGVVIGGSAANKGDCIYVASGGKVSLSGSASPEQIYFAGSSASALTVKGKYTGKVELKYDTAPAAGADIGNCDNAEILKENITIAGTTMCATISGTNLVTANLVGASVTDGEGNVTYHDTLAAAVAAAGKGDAIKLLADNSENVSIENATLDLFGWDMKGNVTGSALYIKDSATDDFTTQDAKGYGVVSGTVTGDVSYAEGYLPLQETNGTSYHKYVLKLSKVSLRPGNSGIYYTGDIQVDEAVQAKLERYGVAVSTNTEIPTADPADEKSLYTAYTKEQYGTADAVSVMISNIMDGEATDAVNAATLVYGRPYILFDDGSYFYGNVCATNMQQLTELIDQKDGSLTLPQFRALSKMYETYKTTVSAWNVPNLTANSVAGETAANDRVLKVLVIGNSHGLDATNLLYEVFKAEGLPEEYDDLILGAIYTGGCSVSTHAKNALNDLPYEYWVKNDGTKADGSWTKTEDPTTREVLEDEDWDIVLLQEMNTSSAREEYFTNDNIETVFTFVANTLGYEPQFMWNMIWANPEIPESYVNHLYADGDDGSGGDVGSGSEGDDNDTSEPAVVARRLAWIFQTQQPGALELWGKNYVKLWENNRQVMYNNIVSNVHNYVVGKEVHNIGMDDVMPNATAIQYAIEWMGMHEQDMYRDYTHVSDLGRLTVAYLYYAKLTGKTAIGDPKYTLVSQTLENSRQTLGYAKDYTQYSDVIKNSVNFALADPYGVIQNYTYAEYLALTPDKQAAYQASFDSFSVHSGWTFDKWLAQAVANVTYTDYVRMTEEQKTVFEGLCADFDGWYASVVENLRFAEYFLLTADEQSAYDQLRGDAWEQWFVNASNNFTYTDYVMYNYEQQQAYQATFSVATDFDNLYNYWLENMTYEEFMALPMHQKLQYRKTYSSIENFLTWYNSVKPQ
ncbi:MAG: DUF4886 domain-containing protein [Oscillospiraceae bacterium]|nr:DUF4886 domain-containing protein [Oscillospiraceae bacterium]